MSHVYSTQELISILASERRACLNGERLSLAVKTSGVNPLIDKFLKSEAVQKFTAYQDFKAAVHRYQREYQVSGIVWNEVTVKGKTLSFPEVNDQLIAIPRDLEILKNAKGSLLNFWYQVTSGMDLYLSYRSGKDYQRITKEDVEKIANRSEWAGLCKWENSSFLEMVLQLSWGKPEEASYRRGWPEAGSDYIHAVNPGCKPIC